MAFEQSPLSPHIKTHKSVFCHVCFTGELWFTANMKAHKEKGCSLGIDVDCRPSVNVNKKLLGGDVSRGQSESAH